MIETISNLAKEKRVEGISDVRDESDRTEKVRIVINKELKVKQLTEQINHFKVFMSKNRKQLLQLGKHRKCCKWSRRN